MTTRPLSDIRADYRVHGLTSRECQKFPRDPWCTWAPTACLKSALRVEALSVELEMAEAVASDARRLAAVAW